MIIYDEIKRAYTEKELIEKELIIKDRNQIIEFKTNEFPLDTKCLIEGLSFEQAYLDFFVYVNILVQYHKIIVEDSVYVSMLSQEYINERITYNLPHNYICFCRDNNILNDTLLIKDLITFSRNSLYHILNESQVTSIIQYIDSHYGYEGVWANDWWQYDIIDWSTAFMGMCCIIQFEYRDMYKCILVDRNCNIIDNDYTDLRIINNETILYEKRVIINELIEIFKQPHQYDDGPIDNRATKIVEQGIINYKGEVLYKGEIGDLNQIVNYKDYIVFSKDKYTFLEKSKIDYYFSIFHDPSFYLNEDSDLERLSESNSELTSKTLDNNNDDENVLEENNNVCDDDYDEDEDEDEEWTGEWEKDYAVCPLCGSKNVQWIETENRWTPLLGPFIDTEEFNFDCGYCKDCDKYYLSKIQLNAADDFESIFNEIADNDDNFIKCLNEKIKRENYDPIWEEDYNTSSFPSIMAEKHIKQYREAKVYTLYSKTTKKLIVPFQPYTICIRNLNRPFEIYLVDNKMKEKEGQLYEPYLKKHIPMIGNSITEPVIGYCHGQYIYPSAIDSNIFYSILDSFRFGVLTGISLSMAFKNHYKALLIYLKKKTIFISMPALQQLFYKYKDIFKAKVSLIISLRDSYFDFKNIDNPTDILETYCHENSRPGFFYKGEGVELGKYIVTDRSWFESESFESVVNKEPSYILSLLLMRRIVVSRSCIPAIKGNTATHLAVIKAINDYFSQIDYPDFDDSMDYERDNWNALTDGQYGDMPDDFDGDYDRFGF